MPRRRLLLLALATTALSAASRAGDGPAYHVVHGWPDLPPDWPYDEVSAVAVDSHDDVLVLTRGGRQWPDTGVLDTTPIPRPTVQRFDGRTGRLLGQWGAGVFAMPHSITVDARDHVWVADVALHQVFELTHDGRVLRTLGTRGVRGDDSAHFDQPSDVAVARDGSIFVSDGYGNNRVVKFAPDGRYLLRWGAKGAGPGQLDLPHALTIDDAGRVLVVDRGNRRVQIFDALGRYRSTWPGPPFVSPQDVDLAHDGTAFVVDNGGREPGKMAVVVLRPDGVVAGRIGRRGNADGQFVDPHWVAVARSGAVYVADFGGRRVQKFVPNTAQAARSR